MLDFLKELTRRKVWLFGGIYLALGWVLLQVAVVIETTLTLPSWVDQITLVLLGLGFPVALLLAWAQESGVVKSGPRPTSASEERPGFSVAVLPLNNLSDERDLDWVADGLSEDIITRLSMHFILMVTARNSSFAWKGKTPDIRDVGEALNVRYVLEGSVRVIDDDLRVTTQLIDTKTGGHIWSANYDHPRARLGGIQDKVVDEVAGEVRSMVVAAEIRRVTSLPEDERGTVDIMAVGWGKAIPHPAFETTAEAITLMKNGLVRFPDAAELHAELAFYCYQQGIRFGREQRAELLRDGEFHLREAIRLDPHGGRTLWRSTSIKHMLGQFDEALTYAEQHAALYPQAGSIQVLPDIYRYLGRYDEAMDVGNRWLKRAGTLHLDWHYVMGFKGDICLGLGDFAGAEDALRKAAGTSPLQMVQRSLIVALAHQGKLAEARAASEVYKDLPGARPLDVIARSAARISRDPAYFEMYIEGLRLAGME